jgi:aspartate kinase
MVKLASEGEMEKVHNLKKNIESKHTTIIKGLGLADNQSLKKQINDYFSKLEIFLIGIYYLREATARVSDAVVAHGELLSTTILAAYLESINKKSFWFDVRQVMRTDNQFGSAIPSKNDLKKLAKKHIAPILKKYDMLITQGFIGSTADGSTTTMGRGGSDYTAALLGDTLNAEAIEIWTDVSGVMTADPRIVKTAFTQSNLSFQEAAELAFFGARVLHPSTILPAIEKNIPVIVKNTLDPNNKGTRITIESKKPGVCKAIAAREKIVVLTVESTRMLLAYGFLEQIFDVFARHKVSVDLISTSEISVSLTITKDQFNRQIVKDLSEFSTVKISENMAILALVGDNIKKSRNFLNQVFTALNGIPIEMITFGTSNVNLSLVIPESHLQKSVERLHKVFFENKGN